LLLPTFGALQPYEGGEIVSTTPDAMKPGFQCVRTPWIRGFMAFAGGQAVGAGGLAVRGGRSVGWRGRSVGATGPVAEHGVGVLAGFGDATDGAGGGVAEPVGHPRH